MSKNESTVEETVRDEATERVAVELFLLDVESMQKTAETLPGIFKWAMKKGMKKNGLVWSDTDAEQREKFRTQADRVARAYRGEEPVGH